MLLLAFAFTSCNEDLDLSGSNIPTAVVYGVISPQDSIHYIKITRAFGGNQNAVDVAQIADSSYFPVLDVTVKEVVNGDVTRTFILNDTTLDNKSPGAWYYPNQKVYYFTTPTNQPLNDNATMKLQISINNGQYTVTGESKIVTGFSVGTPLPSTTLHFANSNVAQNGYITQNFALNTGTAGIVEGRLRVYFDEYAGTTLVNSKMVDWKLGESSGVDIAAGHATFSASGNSFYNLFVLNASNDPSIDHRIYRKTEFVASAGSDELSQYILLSKPSSSLAQSKQSYTNLTASEGAKAIGVFATKVVKTQARIEGTGTNQYRSIDENSMKELLKGSQTIQLLFCTENIYYSNTVQFPGYMCN